MLINIVGQDPDLRVAQQNIGQRLEFRARISRSRWIRGRVQQQPFRFRRDRLLQRPRPQLEAMLDLRFDGNGLAAGDQHHVRIADPIGSRDDHFIARINRREEGVEEDVLAACSDDGLRGRVDQAVLALEFRRDRLPQGRDAGDGVYFVSPRRIAAIAASFTLSGVSKSGSPTDSEIMSRPEFFKSRAFCVTAIVAEGFTRKSASAMNDMEGSVGKS